MKRLLQIISASILIVASLSVIPLAGVVVKCKPFANVEGDATTSIEESKEANPYTFRSEDQTYLTLPEWYIVFYSDEYAAFIQENSASDFPYFRSIWQYWQIYYDVCDIIQERDYPFNPDYQVTLAVIGVSFTAENIMRGVYENTVGRVSDLLRSDEMTAEERYASQVAKEYGDFIHLIPWYEFPFGERLRGLWSETTLWGPNIIRKWERKFALSVEYSGKFLYGWVIRQGAGAAFDTVLLESQARVVGVSDELLEKEPDIRIVEEATTDTLNSEEQIIAIPRYEPFTQIVPRLIEHEVQFVEIAGNDEIAITLIAPQDWHYSFDKGKLLFTRAILSQSDHKRLFVSVPVQSLHLVLFDLNENDVILEHMYDY